MSTTNTSQKVRVGIIDSGFDFFHTTRNPIVSHACIMEKQGKLMISEDREDCHDTWGHGTKCCQIIDTYNENLEFIIVKIFDKGNQSSTHKLSLAINYCLKQDIKILNMSLGFEGHYMSNDLISLLQEAYDSGIVLTAAISDSMRTTFPAMHPLVIGVGNVVSDKNRSNTIFTTSYSPTFIYTTGFDFYENSDVYASSFSCARLTGLIADVLSKNMTLTTDQIKKIFLENSKALPPYFFKEFENDSYGMPLEHLSNQDLQSILDSYYLSKKNRENCSKRVLFLTYGTIEDSDLSILKASDMVIQVEKLNLYKITQDIFYNLIDHLDQFDYICLPKLNRFITKSAYRQIIDWVIQCKLSIILLDDKSYKILLKILKFKNIKEKSILIFYPTIDKAFSDFAQFRFLPSVSIPIICFLNLESTNSLLPILNSLRLEMEQQNNKVAFISSSRNKILLHNTLIQPPNTMNCISLEQEGFLIENLHRGLEHVEKSNCIIREICLDLDFRSKFNTTWIKAIHQIQIARPSLMVFYIGRETNVKMTKEAILMLLKVIDTTQFLILVESTESSALTEDIMQYENSTYDVLYLQDKDFNRKLTEYIVSLQ